MKHSDNVIVAVFALCVFAASCLAQPRSGPPFTGQMLITNDHASFVISVSLTNGRTLRLSSDIGQVTANSIVSTNLHGLWVILSTPTNTFCSGETIACKVLVGNVSQATLNLHSVHAPEAMTGFGEFDVIRRDSGASLARSKLEPSRFGHGGGGSFGPGDRRTFEFNLASLFDLKDPGEYRVTFRGSLPSVEIPAAKVEFETPPLLLTIMTPKSMTYDTKAPSGARPEIR